MAPSKKNMKKKGKSPKVSSEKQKIPVKRSKPSSGFKKQIPGESSKALVLFDPTSSRAKAPQKANKSKAKGASSSEDAEYPDIQTTIAKLRWEFFCQIAGQGRQGLTFEFYTNGWRTKDEDWPEFTTFVRGKVVKFDVDHINKILCISSDPSIYGPTFADFCKRRPNFKEMLQVLCLLHDTTLLLDRVKVLFAIMKGMKIDVRILDNQVMIQSNQAVWLSVKMCYMKGPSFLSSADLDDDLLGEHLGHKALPPFPAAGQSSGDKDNDDNEPATS
ncbi:hypothetical protein SESBI_12747 [Sesbania bispinosa]|nr:hypothetical protein SESBI_12747 [Sesbania bispinosa]